jgi:hypothetical protein
VAGNHNGAKNSAGFQYQHANKILGPTSCIFTSAILYLKNLRGKLTGIGN